MYEKNELRKILKAKRHKLHCELLDSMVCNKLAAFEPYINTDTVLFYAPLNDEINIDILIKASLEKGRRVALPLCSDDKGNMDFYYIKSLSDLKDGYFGVREPDKSKCSKCTEFENTICIVPAVSYDKNGYRLGYGKGYYDRFLKNYCSLSVGLCYNEMIEDMLPVGEYDIPVNYIITQDSVICVRKKEDNNG